MLSIKSYVSSFTGEHGTPDTYFDIMGRVTMKITKMTDDYHGDEYELRTPAALKDADVATSLLSSGRHAPVLDIDVPHKLVPSTTQGHSHLYLDVPMSWWRYKRLLKALAKAGIIEKGYWRASRRRGFTAVRLPWVRKIK